jgi:predicted DNA-binding protein (UPF0251 family)
MTRPRKLRQISCKPICSCFKPQGSFQKSPCGVDLAPDELEAIKLHDVDNLCQKKAADKMRVSQPTFARILSSAQKKVAKALVEGEEIRIN